MSGAARVKQDREAEIAENAAKAFANHVVTVELEQGLYRHYRCAKPGTGTYAFHIVTFPGRLIVSGDIGNMAWSRCPDMLEWAAGAIGSTGYFAEKTWGSIEVREWSEDACREVVEQEHKDHIDDQAVTNTEGRSVAEVAKDTEKANEIRDRLLRRIDDGEHAFATAYYESDWYGGDFPNVSQYTAEFLWCREAVRWFLKSYKPKE